MTQANVDVTSQNVMQILTAKPDEVAPLQHAVDSLTAGVMALMQLGVNDTSIMQAVLQAAQNVRQEAAQRQAAEAEINRRVQERIRSMGADVTEVSEAPGNIPAMPDEPGKKSKAKAAKH